jgi:hypothetical protein
MRRIAVIVRVCLLLRGVGYRVVDCVGLMVGKSGGSEVEYYWQTKWCTKLEGQKEGKEVY